MNLYKITFSKDEYSAINGVFSDIGNEYGYRFGDRYHDVDGKIAFKCRREYLTISYMVEAVSEEAIRNVYKEKVDDNHGNELRLFVGLSIKLVEKGYESPFEILTPNYTKTVRNSYKVLNREFIENVDTFCSEDVQKEYSLVKDKKQYFDSFVTYDDSVY